MTRSRHHLNPDDGKPQPDSEKTSSAFASEEVSLYPGHIAAKAKDMRHWLAIISPWSSG